MTGLRIRMRKGRDGPHTLVCTRPDGSVTMQRHEKDFFPLHDLTHYAVETAMRHRDGFWGLIRRGWELTDFGKPWPRGPMPVNAMVSELIVGMFDLERGTGVAVEAEGLTAHLMSWYATNHRGHEPAAVTSAQIDAARRSFRELHERWHGLEPGDSIELVFDPEAEATAAGRSSAGDP